MDKGTFHLDLAHISDGLMAVGCKMVRERRDEEKHCFMKSSLHKNSNKMKQCVLFKARVPNREKSLLTWTGASHIP